MEYYAGLTSRLSADDLRAKMYYWLDLLSASENTIVKEKIKLTIEQI